MVIDARVFAIALLVAVSGAAGAHGDKHVDGAAPAPQSSEPAAPQEAEQQEFGIAGDPAKVTRTIVVRMSDAMRFSPSWVEVRLGETVRFVIRNRGRAFHEMVLGTQAGLKEHADLMRRFPDMQHDEPSMAHVRSGTTGEIVWQFNRAGEFHYACLVSGHFEAGMVGRVIVR